jgi:hypothetical protein
MAEALGISTRHYRRIELHLEDPWEDLERILPSLGFLVNCSLILGVPFDEVAPPDWQETWTQLSEERPIRPFDFEVEEWRQDWPAGAG